MSDTIASARNESLSYDALSRLTNATGAYGNIDFAYDFVGNRTLRRVNGTGGVTETYSYPSTSNRLSSVSDGTNTRSFTYSNAGHVTGDDPPGSLSYALAYNDNNRLTNVSQSSTALAAYTYDALEHRVIKQVFGTGGYTRHFMYDQDGHLIAESDAAGTVIREYIWLGGLPIGLVDSSGTPTLYFIHDDYRGSPQKATDASKTVVWDAQTQPFGEVYAVSGALTQLLKFPGQYHDGETGYDDNWHRTYDAATGRYLQADPLGLAAGVNLYAYAEGNPLGYVDPLGLAPGDDYLSPDAAADAAIRDINPTSIGEGVEYAGRIYRKWFGYGSYSYTSPNRGLVDRSNPGQCPLTTTAEGIYHTHGRADPNYENEIFSDPDKDVADRTNQPNYLGTPSGNILKYTPRPGTSRGGSVRIIGTGAR